MRSAPPPPDEAERLATLERYAILDTPREEAYDGLVRVAGALFDAPIALISLLDRERQWFKACQGIDFRETERDIAFCPHVIHDRAPIYVPDTHADVRFDNNPIVTGMELRFYCGVPLVAPDGTIPGTLDVLDSRARPDVSPQQIERLQDLAAAVVTLMEYRSLRARCRDLEPELQLHQRLLGALFERSDLGFALTDPGGRIVRVNRRLARWLGVEEDDLHGRYLRRWLEAAASPGSTREARLRRPRGVRSPVRHTAETIDADDGRAYVMHALSDLQRARADRLLERGRADVLKRIARRAEPERTLERIAELPAASDPDLAGYVLVHGDRGEPLVVAPGLELAEGAGEEGESALARALAVLDARARDSEPAEPVAVEALERAGPELAWLARVGGVCSAAVMRLHSEEEVLIGSVGVLLRSEHADPLRPFDCELGEMSQLAAIALHHSSMLARLQWQAHHDELTGLANRTLLRERLAVALEAEPDEAQPLIALVLFDLDQFKAVNDERGHAAGDAVLRRVAERVRGVLRAGDTCARLGGDEFVVFAPVARVGDARGLAGKILQAAGVPREETGAAAVTASVGLALYPAHGGDVETLLEAADRAMYRAKEAGGNRWELPAPG